MNTQHNVSPDNNTLNYTNGSGNQTFVVPAGQYNTAELNTALTAGIADLTFSYVSDHLKSIQVVNSGAASITLNVISPLSPLVGLTADLVIAAGATVRMQNGPDTSGLKIVYLKSNTVSTGNSITSHATAMTNIIAVIPIKVGEGQHNHSESKLTISDQVSYQTPFSFDHPSFELLDENFNRCRLRRDVHLYFRVFYT
jgi:uncharacterized ion transporter superfamily protein YfcC